MATSTSRRTSCIASRSTRAARTCACTRTHCSGCGWMPGRFSSGSALLTTNRGPVSRPATREEPGLRSDLVVAALDDGVADRSEEQCEGERSALAQRTLGDLGSAGGVLPEEDEVRDRNDEQPGCRHLLGH